MVIINMTHGEVKIMRVDGTAAILPPCGVIPSRNVVFKPIAVCNGVEFCTASYGRVIDLPAPEDGVIYFVEQDVWEAIGEARTDCVTYGKPVYDRYGAIIAYKGVAYNGR